MGKRAKPEEVIAKLREIEIRLARRETAAAAARAVGVTEQSYYRWWSAPQRWSSRELVWRFPSSGVHTATST